MYLGSRRPFNRKLEHKDRAASIVLLSPNGSAVSVHHVLCDSQSESGPRRPTRTICLVKPLEEPGQVCSTDSDPSIPNLDLDLIVHLKGVDRNLPTGRSELDRIVNEVEQNLIYPGTVGDERWRSGRHHDIESQTGPFDQRRQATNRIADDIGRFHALQRQLSST